MRRRVEFLALVVLLVCGVLAAPQVFALAYSDAETAVADADHALQAAFVNVSQAEEAGANVSGLFVRLNEAGAVLGEAEFALASGNLGEAVDKAGACVEIAHGVESDAGVLRAAALDAAGVMFWVYVVFSVVSVSVFVVVLFFVWRWFKRGYVRRVLGLRPEVGSGEA